MTRPRIGSLCSGYAGLDMGAQAAIGGRTVWFAEFDKAPSKILTHHWPQTPNLGDLTAVDWADVEAVEVLTAGFPCQPVSKAGKRLGDLDERWLWDDVARAVGALRPELVLLENVRGLLTAGAGRLFGEILGSLANLGYDAQWHGLRASDIGAPHERFRVFIAAHPHNPGRREQWRPVPVRAEQRPAQRPSALLPTPAVNDMGRGKTVEAWDEWTAKMQAAHGNGNGHGKSLEIEAQRTAGWGQYAEAIHRWENLTRPAPSHVERDEKDGQYRLSPAFVEWMMGLPAGHVTDVPGLSRNDMLKALGNGVVPQQAEAALRFLLGVTASEAVA